LTAPKRILIAGYYGFSNTGDEAVLASIVSGLRRQAGDDLDIVVLSARPEETARTYGVRSVGRMEFRRVRESIRGCDLFISGGGSLLQDATSFKSLAYYLFLIEMAERAGRKVMVLGQGIGPLRRTMSRMLTRRALDRVSLITVRDDESAALLAQIGVKRPRIEVTSDPTFALRPCPPEEAQRLLAEAGIGPDEDVAAVSLREWPEAPVMEIAAVSALADLANRLPARLLMIPMQMPGDAEMARRIRRSIGDRIAVLPDGCSPEQVMGAISACRMVVAMRLHALIFAASAGVPALGISYDPKVTSFLAAAGQDGISLGEVTSGLLADRVIESWNRRDDLAVRLGERVPKMRELAEQNFRLAADLLHGP
jgi:polysaccharide pyruvyl transferase CsaB